MLVVEKDEELMKDFGRAVLYHNSVEFFLKSIFGVLANKAQNSEDREKIENELIKKRNSNLGGLIKIAKDFNLIDILIIKRLETLNKNRRLLAHGIVGEKMFTHINNKSPIASGIYSINNNGSEVILNKNILHEMIVLAEQCQKLLTKQLIPFVSPHVADIYRKL